MDAKLQHIYDVLLDHYGEPHWWPAETPYEVMVGAILTQNTAWANVEKAIAGFGAKLSPMIVADADMRDLIDIIRPAGSYNRKAKCLQAVTAWYAEYHYDVSTVCRESLPKIRAELLAIQGIGQETADSIMLYAFNYPTFVVDAYTVRLCERFPIETGHGYAEIKACFESNVPPNVGIYNNYHALIVINGKTHCKKNPLCEGCPLGKACAKARA